MPNHKEIIQKKASDKKINSATNHVYEKQHNELTIKSKTDSLPQDSNNIRVQTRLQSEKKQNTEDIIDKCLNDSKYKKSQIQKVEKLDIKIKEKLEIDTRNTMKNKATEDQNKVLKDLQDKVFFDLKEKLSENNLNSEDKYESFPSNKSQKDTNKMKSFNKLEKSQTDEKMRNEVYVIKETTRKIQSIPKNNSSSQIIDQNITNDKAIKIENTDNIIDQKSKRLPKEKENSVHISDEISKNSNMTKNNKIHQDSNLNEVIDDENSIIEMEAKKEFQEALLKVELSKNYLVDEKKKEDFIEKNDYFEINELEELSFESEKDHATEEKANEIKKDQIIENSKILKKQSIVNQLTDQKLCSNNTIEPVNEEIIDYENKEENVKKDKIEIEKEIIIISPIQDIYNNKEVLKEDNLCAYDLNIEGKNINKKNSKK